MNAEDPAAAAAAQSPAPMPDLQPAVAGAQDAAAAGSTNDARGTAETPGAAGIAQRIESAGLAAAAQHLEEQPAPKRKSGQRGPDRFPGTRPRRPAPVQLAPMDRGTFPPLLDDYQAEPLAPAAPDLPAPLPPFDRDTAAEMAAFATEFLNDIAAAGMESWSLKHLQDADLAAAAGARCRMSDDLKSRWEKSLVKLAEKHRIALDLAPEIIAGGCLLLWGTNIKKQAQAIKLQGAELRGEGMPLQTL